MSHTFTNKIYQLRINVTFNNSFDNTHLIIRPKSFAYPLVSYEFFQHKHHTQTYIYIYTRILKSQFIVIEHNITYTGHNRALLTSFTTVWQYTC
jgi:hypothetical protein